MLHKLKLKLIIRRLINSTESRMKKNLQPLHYKLIDDKSSGMQSIISEKENISSNKSTKKMNLEYSTYQDKSSEAYLFKNILKMVLAKLFYRNVLCSWIGQFINKIPVISPNGNFKLLWDISNISIIAMIIFFLPI